VSISKRDLLCLMAGSLAATGFSAAPLQADEPKPAHDMSGMPPTWMGSEKIAFLIYPQFTALDMVGPHYMLSTLMGASTFTVAKSNDPVVSDSKLTLVPTHSFSDCPVDLDIICVPGGASGTLAAMQDEATIAFLKDRGSRAKYVTSVCTGSLILGAAGLLRGYKATSHWVTRDILKDLGAEPVDARVVKDRNRITGAGVTAGLDFGLSLVGALRDQRYAEAVQLLAEYDPEPPYQSGTPAKASKENLDMYEAMFADFKINASDAAKKAIAKL